MTGLGPALILRGLAAGTLAVVWAGLAHFASAGDVPADFSAVLATAPIVALVVILLWRIGNPLWIIAGGGSIMAFIIHAWPLLRQNIALLYYLQHLGINLSLGILFGRSLRQGNMPLVSQFAQFAQTRPLSGSKQRYTRQVTQAWAIFFLLSASVSSVLFWLAPATAWSIFANLLALPLLLAMFVAEHCIRQRVLAPEDRSSIADTIRGYRATMRRRTHP